MLKKHQIFTKNVSVFLIFSRYVIKIMRRVENLMRTLIFGAGSTGRNVYQELKVNKQYDIIGFLDNDEKLSGGNIVDGIKVIGNYKRCNDIDFDQIVIASLTGRDIIKEQLIKEGVPIFKINTRLVDTQVEARINFLRDYANTIQEKNQMNLCVAEGGVFQGEFAKEINRVFPSSKMYLFDTFEGFDERDLIKERNSNFSEFGAKHLSTTSEDMVLGKLLYKDNVIIRKGFFPETAYGLENEKFVFVNLDFDLYDPILAGLRIFFPKMVKGGVILVHDYYNNGYKGVKQAVEKFEKEHSFTKIPIGDHCSICIVK